MQLSCDSELVLNRQEFDSKIALETCELKASTSKQQKLNTVRTHQFLKQI